MASFVIPANGDDATAESVAQIIEDLSGLRNIPISLSGINDAAAYAATVKNAGTGSKGLIIYAADGTTVLLQVDGTGVRASRTGGAAERVLTTGESGTITAGMIGAGAITNSLLATDVARPNLLINPTFDLWQRGTSISAGGAYGPDGWLLSIGAASTLTVARDNTHQDNGSSFCASLTYVHSALSELRQVVEDFANLATRTVTFSLRVRTATGSAVRLRLANGVTSAFSAYHTGGGSYETLSVSLAMGAASACTVNVALEASSTVYIDSAVLVVGTIAPDFQPPHPADQLARAEREYEVHGGASATGLRWVYHAGAAATYAMPIVFREKKGGTPTVTKNGTWTVSNSGQPGIAAASQDGYSLTSLATGAGQTTVVQDSSDDTITAEWVP